MILDVRIKVFGSDSFRPRLSLEDIVFGNGNEVEVASSNPALSSDDVQFIERALVFVDAPIAIPNMTYLYSSKLWNLKSSLLERLVRDLVFLNPEIGDAGVNKMVSWIVSYFVGVNKNSNYKKVLCFEDLLPKVSYFVGKYLNSEIDIIESNKVILYKRDSLLEATDKRWYSLFYRRQRMSTLTEELIHEGALLASKVVDNRLVIKRSVVLDNTAKIKLLQVLNKHIGERTIKFLKDENRNRHFKSQTSLDKFIEFASVYIPSAPLDYYVKELNISKTSAVEFKKLLKDDSPSIGIESLFWNN